MIPKKESTLGVSSIDSLEVFSIKVVLEKVFLYVGDYLVNRIVLILKNMILVGSIFVLGRVGFGKSTLNLPI